MSESLRTRQQAATRAAIIDAFLELAHAENAVGISMPGVAARAGVSVRTVYRYFATKDELQTAAAYFFNDRAREQLGGAPDTSTFEDYLLTLWSDFATSLTAVAAEHATPAGRRLRATRLPGSRAVVQAALPKNTDPETIDLIIAVTSSSMFLELVDRMGYEPKQAVSMVSRLVRDLERSAHEAPFRSAQTNQDTGETHDHTS